MPSAWGQAARSSTHDDKETMSQARLYWRRTALGGTAIRHRASAMRIHHGSLFGTALGEVFHFIELSSFDVRGLEHRIAQRLTQLIASSSGFSFQIQ